VTAATGAEIYLSIAQQETNFEKWFLHFFPLGRPLKKEPENKWCDGCKLVAKHERTNVARVLK
jgi:hypothetical protein